MVKRTLRSCPASLFPFQEKLLCSCDRALMCHPDSDVLPVCPPKRTSALRVNESTPRFPQFPQDPQVWLLHARKLHTGHRFPHRFRSKSPKRLRSRWKADLSVEPDYGRGGPAA
jgi:hypothetical protein